MLHQVIATGIVLAQEDAEPSGGLGSFLLLLIMGGAAYFIFFGPQRRRMKAMRAEVAEARENVAFGDDIVTVGGIIGRVVSTTENDVTIDVGGGIEMRILRRAIAERIGDDPE